MCVSMIETQNSSVFVK